jgi:hypothetical protein
MVGLGAKYTVVGPLDVFFDARYAFGFAEIQKYSSDALTASPDLEKFYKNANRTLVLSLGVAVNLGL